VFRIGKLHPVSVDTTLSKQEPREAEGRTKSEALSLPPRPKRREAGQQFGAGNAPAPENSCAPSAQGGKSAGSCRH
jgi:hypothetical protein